MSSLLSCSNGVISILNCIFSACFICFLASLLTSVEMNKFRNLRDMQKVSLRFRSERFFRLRGIRRNVLPKFIELGFETPAVLASLWGTQIWRPETNRNIAIKRVLISRELISIKLNTYSKNKDCSGSKIKNKKICRSLTYSNVTAFAYVLLPYYCRVTQYIRIFKRVLSQDEEPFRTETL